jgi:hypothetical protein
MQRRSKCRSVEDARESGRRGESARSGKLPAWETSPCPHLFVPQAGARGRASRKRANAIKHQKQMEAEGFGDEHAAAATKIQSIGRSKKDRKRVEAIRKQKEMEAQLASLEPQMDEAPSLLAPACRPRPSVSLDGRTPRQ